MKNETPLMRSLSVDEHLKFPNGIVCKILSMGVSKSRCATEDRYYEVFVSLIDEDGNILDFNPSLSVLIDLINNGTIEQVNRRW